MAATRQIQIEGILGKAESQYGLWVMLTATGTAFSQYGFYWDYRQRTKSFYVGKQLPKGVEVLPDPIPVPGDHASPPLTPDDGGDMLS